MSNAHIWAWCKWKGILWIEHPQSTAKKNKTFIFTTEDHKAVVLKRVKKLEHINNDVCAVDELLSPLETCFKKTLRVSGKRYGAKSAEIFSSFTLQRTTWSKSHKPFDEHEACAEGRRSSEHLDIIRECTFYRS
jgi:hypothetical protein